MPRGARLAGTDPAGPHADAFWKRHVDMGVGSFVLGAVALLVYFLRTPHGAHRGALEVLGITSIACWIFVFAPVGRWAVTTRWRRSFFRVWSLSTLVVVVVAVALDGGSKSPLGVLLVLPVLFAALVYPPFEVGMMALLSETAFVVIVVSEPGPGASRSLVTGVMLALAGVISLMASVNRYVQERSTGRLQTRLHELATHDGLTGCLSYRAFREALSAEAARARRYLRPFSVVLADLDSFKSINDTYGHDVGDVIVRGVARAFRTGARAPDVVGRIGGDEFAILLPETSSVRAEQVARRLQQHVRNTSFPVAVTVSYGSATWFGPGDDLEEVIRRADQALYAAKHAGRDRLLLWESLG
ncbi:MAG: GGDEF domain-containing protein [Acidimicrobiales bacterium]